MWVLRLEGGARAGVVGGEGFGAGWGVWVAAGGVDFVRVLPCVKMSHHHDAVASGHRRKTASEVTKMVSN
jgi:hypothetical protein